MLALYAGAARRSARKDLPRHPRPIGGPSWFAQSAALVSPVGAQSGASEPPMKWRYHVGNPAFQLGSALVHAARALLRWEQRVTKRVVSIVAGHQRLESKPEGPSCTCCPRWAALRPSDSVSARRGAAKTMRCNSLMIWQSQRRHHQIATIETSVESRLKL